MGTALQLQRASEREALIQDQLVADFDRELTRLIRRTDRELARLLRALDQESHRLVRTRAAIGRAVRLRQDLVEALNRAGFPTLAQRFTDERLDDLADVVLTHATIAGRAARLTRVDLAAIEAFKQVRHTDLLGWRDATAHALWRVTLDGVLGLRDPDDLIVDVGDLLDLSAPRALTIYDTAVSTFSRQMNLLHTTGEPSELFYYAGPLDRVTRPFCRQRVGKVFTRSAIEDMDNGQIPNVLIACGGYNCRHVFKQVSILDEELQRLHETGERLPHVQQQLDALDEAA